MSHKGLSDDATTYRHCVATLTGPQLDPKVRAPAAWPPAEYTEEFPVR